MDEIVIRGIERIVVVLGGGLAIYLGYKLFINLPEKSDQSGEIKLPGNISIYLSRVGPGVFFSLFGVAVLVASLYFQMVKYEPGQSAEDLPAGDGGTGGMVLYSYDISGSSDMDEVRNKISQDIAVLANATRLVERSTTDPRLQRRLTEAVETARLALVGSVWDKEWGDPRDFVRDLKKPAADTVALKKKFPRAFELYASGK